MSRGFVLIVSLLTFLIAGVVVASDRDSISESQIRVSDTVPAKFKIISSTLDWSDDQISAIGGIQISDTGIRTVDVTPPVIAGVLIDNQQVVTDDYVSRTPQITASIYDTDALISTWNISILDSNLTPVAGATENANHAAVSASITVVDSLATGRYTIRVRAWDSAGYESILDMPPVRIGQGLRIDQLVAGPNPLSPRTQQGRVEFQITQDADVEIKILGMSGRIVFSDHRRVAAGFNRVDWDGRDPSGDWIANGPYLVVVVAKSGSDKTTARFRLLVLK